MLEIVVGRASIQQSTSGRVTGVLFVRHSEGSFPDGEWNDFLDVVLAWWCDALAELNTGAPNVVLRFMDGPFRLEVSGGSRLWSVRGFSRDQGAPTFVEHVSAEGVAATLREASTALLAEAEERGFIWTADLQNLRRALDSIS